MPAPSLFALWHDLAYRDGYRLGMNAHTKITLNVLDWPKRPLGGDAWIATWDPGLVLPILHGPHQEWTHSPERMCCFKVGWCLPWASLATPLLGRPPLLP